MSWRRPVLVALAAVAIAVVPVSASARVASPTPQGGTWENAELVPGTAVQNGGGWAGLDAVSCVSPGNCDALGFYTASNHVERAFTTRQVNGHWELPAPARGVPGVANGAIALSMSCLSPGDCTAAGSYNGSYATNNLLQGAFVMSESGGTWGSAEALAGLDKEINPAMTSIFCPAAGDCAAVGTYLDARGFTHAFVIDETDGTWGDAQDFVTVGDIGHGDFLGTPLVSCVSAGNCLATVSDYVNAETNGIWGTAAGARELPTALTVTALSCATDGQCTVGGQNSSGAAAVDTETNGTWSTPTTVAQQFNVGANAWVMSLSCTAGGNCGAGGYYVNASGTTAPFVADEKAGMWTPGSRIPQSASSDKEITGISCPSPGNCGATGAGLVVDEVNGTWRNPQPIPGPLGQGASPAQISCPAPGFCTMGGQSGNQAFVASEATGTVVTLTLSTARVTYGNEQTERLSVSAASTNGGTPAGTAAINAVLIAGGRRAICVATLTAGQGSCTIPATRLGGGTYHLTATYTGASLFAPSTSSPETLTVTKASSTTQLGLSAGTAVVGHENTVRVSATVLTRHAGTPWGKVVVKAGNTVICVITLRAGQGTCRLPARKLKVGSYQITASYLGNADFFPSASVRKTLRITRSLSRTDPGRLSRVRVCARVSRRDGDHDVQAAVIARGGGDSAAVDRGD